MITLSAQRPDATRDGHLFARPAQDGGVGGREADPLPAHPPRCHLQEYSHCSSTQQGRGVGGGIQRGGVTDRGRHFAPFQHLFFHQLPKLLVFSVNARKRRTENKIPGSVDELQGSAGRRNNVEWNSAAAAKISNRVNPSASVAAVCTDMHFDTANTACRRGESSTAAVVWRSSQVQASN